MKDKKLDDKESDINQFEVSSFNYIEVSGYERMGERRNGFIFEQIPGEKIDRLFDNWKAHLNDEFPSLLSKISSMNEERSKFFFYSALDGLVDYLKVCSATKNPSLLPSKAADTVWHAWIKRDPEDYESFCQKFLGRVVEHVENDKKIKPLSSQEFDDRLSETWVGIYRAANAKPGVFCAPPLFLLDSHLGMPEGWAYKVDGIHISHQEMDIQGKAFGHPKYHQDINLNRMKEIGLITEEELKFSKRPDTSRIKSFLKRICSDTDADRASDKLSSSWLMSNSPRMNRKNENSGGGSACGTGSSCGGCGGGGG